MWTLDIDTRRRYVQGMTGLSVWYIHALLEQQHLKPADVERALCDRVNLYRLTDLWDGQDSAVTGADDPRWQAIATQLSDWIRTTPSQHISDLEARSLTLLDPLLETRLSRDVGAPPTRPFSCWTYELGWPGLADRPGLLGKVGNWQHTAAILRKRLGLKPTPSTDAVLHFMNVLAPRSPFEDVPALAQSLRDLIQDVRQRHPQVKNLWCNTWLNDYPRFRELFPDAWFQSATVAAPGHFRNWWGQFATRDGDFNRQAAQRFRDAGGVFPYRALQCSASLDSIDQHLRGRRNGSRFATG